MNRNSKSENTSQKYIDEFLKKGGEITICEPHARTENVEYTGGMWGRRKKKPQPSEDSK